MLNRQNKGMLGGFMVLLVIFITGMYLRTKTVAVLSPKGPIAAQEKTLLLTAVGLMLIVVVPLFILLFSIAWKYRATNKTARYTPDWDRHRGFEAIWWTIPLLLVVSLSVLTWQSTHRLDPRLPIASKTKPIYIQAVALKWKWLFIYPEQKVASVNYLPFPAGTPLSFDITSDGAMNSFWIPQLGGQIYAMSGMSTQLHLLADKPGTFRGSSANISGKGFAGMHFNAQATTKAAFDDWVTATKSSAELLNTPTFAKLSEPSEYNKPHSYTLLNDSLYASVINSVDGPHGAMSGMSYGSYYDYGVNR